MEKTLPNRQSKKPNGKPNILLLFPDQHRGDWLPYSEKVYRTMGIETLPVKMPNVKKLMDEGVTFTRAITSSPLCAPARACLASGLKYEKCRVADNSIDYPLDQKTFYSVLKENGYNVGGVGKFDLHKPTHWWGLDGWIDDLGTLGFTHGVDNAGKIDAVVSGKEEPKDPYMKYLHDIGMAKYHCEDLIGRGRKTHATELDDEAYCDNWLSQQGINMLNSFSKDKPWFIQFNFTGPHDPFDITKRMKKRWHNVQFPAPNHWTGDNEINSIRQNYAAMLENIDRNIGLIIEEIEKRDELDNTIIIYSSDHGEMLGDFDVFGKCKPQRGSVHIPLIVSGPGIKKGIHSDSLVELQDLTSTIVEYAGASMVEAEDSVSLIPILKGIKMEHREYQTSGLKRNNHSKIGWKIICDKKYKLIIEENKEPMLFDLQEDPWENNDISKENEDIIDSLKNIKI